MLPSRSGLDISKKIFRYKNLSLRQKLENTINRSNLNASRDFSLYGILEHFLEKNPENRAKGFKPFEGLEIKINLNFEKIYFSNLMPKSYSMTNFVDNRSQPITPRALKYVFNLSILILKFPETYRQTLRSISSLFSDKRAAATVPLRK